MLVAGVDSSTQSTKVVLCRAEDGEAVDTAAAPHPDGTECDPRHWWDALTECLPGVVRRGAEGGGVAAPAAAPPPDGPECAPRHWWDALTECLPVLSRASAVAVAGQQHGMVTLDAAGSVVRPALLWNDVRSAPQA